MSDYTDQEWRDALREMREVAIAGDMPKIKRMIYDLILFGPAQSKPPHPNS